MLIFLIIVLILAVCFPDAVGALLSFVFIAGLGLAVVGGFILVIVAAGS
jgi:hypothetical protein